MSSMLLEIVTPERLLLSQEVYMVNAVGTEGAMGILPGHAHLLTALAVSPLRWQEYEGAEEKKAAVCGGFMEVTPTKISILAETAELGEHIDKDRCLLALKRAEARIQQVKTGSADIDIVRAERALQRAIARLKVLD